MSPDQLTVLRAFDGMELILWSSDAHGEWMFINSRSRQALPASIRPADWLALIHPDDAVQVAQQYHAAKVAGDEYRYEYRVRRVDGSWRWMLDAAAPVTDANGQPAGYIGTIVDISAQRDALERLARSDAEQRLLMEHTSDLIAHCDINANYLYVSPGYTKLLGWTSEEMVGKSIFAFLHPDDQKTAPAAMARLLQPGQEQRVAEIRKRDRQGRYIWLGSKVRAVTDPVTGEYQGAVLVSRVVDAERQAREELRRSEARFRSLTQLSADWYWETDADDSVIVLSDGVQRTLGLSPNVGTGARMRDLIADPDDSATQIYADTVARRAKVDNLILPMPDANGELRQVLVNGEPFFDNGAFAGYRGVARDVTEQRVILEQLARMAEENQALIENAPDIMMLLDLDGVILRANDAVEAVTGYVPEMLVGRQTMTLVTPESLATTETALRALREGRQEMGEFANAWQRNDGSEVQLAWSLHRPHGATLIYATARDVSEAHAARLALDIAHQQVKTVLESIGDAFFSVNRDWRLTYLNRNTLLFIGQPEDGEPVLGRLIWDVVPELPETEAFAYYQQAMRTRENIAFETFYEPYQAWVSVRVYAHEDGLSVFFHDITERKQAEVRLEQLANRDSLTGLPNRAYINRVLRQMLDEQSASPLSVMFIDLDRFKEVNDSLGHGPGDQLLQQVACRLQEAMGERDVLARLGGDEFAVVARCARGKDDAVALATRLLAALSLPARVGGYEMTVSASIGICMADDGLVEADTLFQNADTAMYRAKAAGRNNYCLFEPQMSVEAKTRLALEQALRTALIRQEFELHYQPRIDLVTLRITGVEALLRWNHPELGSIPPAQFIPLAEERGHIESIGKWVLDEACRQVRALNERGSQTLNVSINLSARQLRCADLVDQVRDALVQSGLSPNLLELELTESALIDDIDQSAQVLTELKALGISLSIDDFGTGYSSLSYLKRFPADILKLDRSFIAQQTADGNSPEFIKAFVDMAHALKMSVVAEGIETEDVLQMLRDALCDEGQGFLFARPLTLPDLESYLSQLPPTQAAGRLPPRDGQQPDTMLRNPLANTLIATQFVANYSADLVGHHSPSGNHLNVSPSVERTGGDVTREREARNPVTRRQARFESLTRLSADWYWETDADGRFTFISDGVLAAIGIRATDLLGTTLDSIAANANALILAHYHACRQQQLPFRDIGFSIVNNRSCDVRDIRISGDPMFEDGACVGYCGIGTDVTELVRQQRQLEHLAAENNSLIDHSLDIFMVLNAEGVILRANRAATEILGYPPPELIDRSFLNFVSPDRLEATRPYAQQVMTSKSAVRDYEDQWLRKDGSTVYLSWSSCWSDDGTLIYATARDVTERRHASEALQNSKEELNDVLESLTDAVFAVDRQWRITYTNSNCAGHVGMTPEETRGKVLWELVPDLLLAPFHDRYVETMETGVGANFEGYMPSMQTWFGVRAYPRSGGIAAFFHDITKEREAAEKVHRSEQRLRQLLAVTPTGYLRVDVQGTIREVNGATCALCGYTDRELVGMPVSQLFAERSTALSGMMAIDEGRLESKECTLLHRHGHTVVVLSSTAIERDASGQPVALAAFITDITGRKAAEDRLTTLATSDALTGLPNRHYLNEQLPLLLRHAPRGQHTSVMFIDLDRFKAINDRFGHASGDEVLREIADRLRKHTRSGDLLARIGGDEFILVAPCGSENSRNQDWMATTSAIAEKLVAALSAPLDIDGQDLALGVSIGIAVYPVDGNDAAVLLAQADAAMYRVKLGGRNGFAFHRTVADRHLQLTAVS